MTDQPAATVERDQVILRAVREALERCAETHAGQEYRFCEGWGCMDVRPLYDLAVRLNVENVALVRELERERHLFPADGVWLVTGERASSQRIARLGEVPDPLTFAALARHRDAIAAAVSRCWSAYRDRGFQAPIDVADAILRAVSVEEP